MSCMLTPLLPQYAANRFGHAPDNPVAYINYLGIRQWPFKALVGELVGQRFMPWRDRLAAVNVEEFHFAEQGAATFANRFEYLGGGDLFGHNKCQVFHNGRVGADGLYWLYAPTGLDQRVDLHFSRAGPPSPR